MVYYRMNSPHKTIEYEEMAIPIFEKLGRQNYLAQIRGVYGLQLHNMGDYEGAMEQFEMALLSASEVKVSSVGVHVIPHYYKAKTLREMGQIHKADYEINLAISKAIDFELFKKQHFVIPRILAMKAQISFDLGDKKAGMSYLDQAFNIAQSYSGSRSS